MKEEPLLSIRDLSVVFETDEGNVPAVDHVSFDVMRGETLGIVGESGCGKSVTSMSILRLIPMPPGRITSGAILFDNKDTLRLDQDALRAIRGRRISVIFQEPMTSLSPLMRIGSQLVETIQIHRPVNRRSARKEAAQWLKRVGIPDAERVINVYPYELSGGMRQRVMIAMALILSPELIIADEPTTALDVTIQAQIMDLLRDMRTRQTSILLITHDMGVIWEMCERVVVMYASEVVEIAPVASLFSSPSHPYSEALIRSVPSFDQKQSQLPVIHGQVPSPKAHPAGCRFADRCPFVFDRCRKEHPELYRIDDTCVSRCFLRDTKKGETDER